MGSALQLLSNTRDQLRCFLANINQQKVLISVTMHIEATYNVLASFKTPVLSAYTILIIKMVATTQTRTDISDNFSVIFCTERGLIPSWDEPEGVDCLEHYVRI